MSARVHRALLPAALLLLSAWFGCGGKSKPKTIPVSGTVTVDGENLADGVIYFKTVETGAFESFPIKAGRFKGDAQEGERRIEISAYRTKTVDGDRMKSEVKENLIPAKYNVESTQTARVIPPGPNTFQFELLTK